MLEMLVAGGGKPYYPNSGPGPKSLAGGNEQAGYFGTLTQAQLFTPTEIFNLLGIPAIGPSTDTSTIWCKFYYKGKIIYIPTRPINIDTQQFSWEALYQLGVVYGTDDNGAFPSPAASPMNQRVTFSKTLEGKTAGFWPRLSAASNVDPTDITSAANTGLGEFAELLPHVYQTGYRFGTGKWDSLPTGSLSETTIAGIMKTSAGTGTGMINGAPGTSAGKMTYGSSGKSVTSGSWRWWPVLQYINPSESLLDLTGFTADNPPPRAVDVYAAKGESAGGIVSIRSLRSDLIDGAVLPKVTTPTLKSPSNIAVGLIGSVPRITAASTASVPTSPSNFKVSLLGSPPVPTVKQSQLTGPYGLTARYTPVPLTGIKLVDQ